MKIGLTIPRRNVCCSRGEESLLRESLYYSVLEEKTPRQWIRHDFCPACWENLSIQDIYPKIMAQWRVEKRSKQTKISPSSFFQERGVAHLLDLLEEGDRAKAFLWALVLQREKILLLRKEGKEEWIFEEEGKGSFIRFPPVALSTEHVKELNMWLQDVYANS